MGDDFAAYAWSNDQRIDRVDRAALLEAVSRARFWVRMAARSIAVLPRSRSRRSSIDAPEREHQALKAVQRAPLRRWLGCDIAAILVSYLAGRSDFSVRPLRLSSSRHGPSRGEPRA